jgi:aryl-alcohol dehydrogenase-like predicted oxidoreductase
LTPVPFDPAGPPRPILGLAGLPSLGWSRSRRSRSAVSLLDAAYDEGYRVLDTAAIYGLGASEKGLGRWMEARRNRDRVAVISKGGHPPLLRPARHRLTPECLAEDLAASLRRLRTDYLDLYLLHRDAPECDLRAVLQYLHEQKRRGTVRAFGVSNWHHARIEEANGLARREGLTEFSASSPQLSLLSWTRPPWRGSVSISGGEGAPARSWYAQAALPVLAWSPFGGGLREDAATGWTVRAASYRHPANTARLARAAAIGQVRGLSVPQVMIAYLSSLPLRVHPIYASSRIEHLRANRAAMDVELSPEEVRGLEGE